ncbi:ankyrin repeat-containing domain protein [Lactarius akahatsu]|uniref:Palmitoyltransferase n=1 Tax=Lactarius akahatsu TaxID=416441 RepID=A0AAD4Q6J8_9AGAM|nr:ankyrin repeat-containing domain protein [Lactarius akahatsu]
MDAMEERVKVDDRVASVILHASAADNTMTSDTESGGTFQEGSSAPELNIFTAARLGKTECIQALIQSGRARLTDRDEDDITALHWAAISGQAETCEYLIDHGAELNAVTRTLLASPLQWAALQGLPDIVHLLIRHGADPRLLDAQGYSSLHAAVHSSSYWCLLLLLCQPEVSPDERDRKGRTALHWAARQRDEVSTRLVAAGAQLRTRDGEQRTARDWDEALAEMGLSNDGMKVCRPLSEPHVKVIVFSVPSLSLCIAFAITSVFPWYMSVVLAPAALVAMHLVVLLEFLQRGTVSDSIYSSPYFLGIIFGSGLWIAYGWATRLRYGAHHNPYLHALFGLLFGLCVVALVFTTICDPGTIDILTKDELKPIIEDLIQRKQLTTKAFCVRCLAARPPHTRHCSRCNKCVTRNECMDLHASWMLNCIGTKTHAYFIVFITTFTACVLIFDYLVWIYLVASDEVPPPRSSCVLPHKVCRFVSGDMFLSSVAAWSSLQMIWSGVVAVNYGDAAWRAWRRRVKSFSETAVVFST